MAKGKFRNKDSKDLNEGYSFVKMENLEEYKGTIEEFLSQITHLRPGYMKKPSGKTILHFWWEDKESWFMNHGSQTISNNNKEVFNTTGGWYIAKDMPIIIKGHVEDKYKMYFKKKL
jgi:hypothetical protein